MHHDDTIIDTSSLRDNEFKIQNLLNEMSQLKMDNYNLRYENNYLQSTEQILELKNSKLDSSLEEANNKLNEYKMKLHEQQQQELDRKVLNTAKQEQLDLMNNQHLSVHQEQLLSSNKLRKQAEEHVTELSKQLNELENTLHMQLQVTAEEVEKNVQLKSKVIKLENEINEMKFKDDQFMNQSSQQQNKIALLEKEKSELVASETALRTELRHIKLQYEKVTQQLDESKNYIQTLKSSNEKLKSLNDSGKQLHEEHSVTVEKLKTNFNCEVEKLTEKFNSYYKELQQKSTEKIIELEKTIAIHEARLMTNSKLEKKLEEAHSQYEAKSKEYNELLEKYYPLVEYKHLYETMSEERTNLKNELKVSQEANKNHFMLAKQRDFQVKKRDVDIKERLHNSAIKLKLTKSKFQHSEIFSKSYNSYNNSGSSPFNTPKSDKSKLKMRHLDFSG